MVALAHSARHGYPAQTYSEHLGHVCQCAVAYAEEAAQYNRQDGGTLTQMVRQAADWHDLGKLEPENQQALRQPDSPDPLPLNHVDAGAAQLLLHDAPTSALLVYAHHGGLKDILAETARGDACFRAPQLLARTKTDQTLPTLTARHRQLISTPEIRPDPEPEGDYGLLLRLALSCLADADHSDTAAHYGQPLPDDAAPVLRAEERLQALDIYAAQLADDSLRSQLRSALYQSCRTTATDSGFASCDSPVGSGKTTALMAHLLKQAHRRHARRIFVVLPYTNIISQAVEVYRRALVLPGENPEAVVAELHHRADFESKDTRRLTALWRAPIIVTTAVSFFEILAANRPAALRRLHELPGSLIFLDEAHASLPLTLLPLAWRWMNILAREWGCYWLLASGSLVRFWQIPELTQLCPDIPELTAPALRTELLANEARRIDFPWLEQPLSREDLLERVLSAPGPRLLILNTVQSAAVIANDICRRQGRARVEHISSALSPEHRSVVIERLTRRLADKTDRDWTLVATSCVEAGMDFSFRSGFRELSSLLSLLQTAGRISRGGEYPAAALWSFSLQDDSLLQSNPALKPSVAILRSYLSRRLSIDPERCTQAIRDQLLQYDADKRLRQCLLDSEAHLAFASIAKDFQIIEADTVPVLVDAQTAALILQGGGDWQLLQKHSVPIARHNLAKWNVREISKGLYQWNRSYDDFLGIMAGVIIRR